MPIETEKDLKWLFVAILCAIPLAYFCFFATETNQLLGLLNGMGTGMGVGMAIGNYLGWKWN